MLIKSLENLPQRTTQCYVTI